MHIAQRVASWLPGEFGEVEVSTWEKFAANQKIGSEMAPKTENWLWSVASGSQDAALCNYMYVDKTQVAGSGD